MALWSPAGSYGCPPLQAVVQMPLTSTWAFGTCFLRLVFVALPCFATFQVLRWQEEDPCTRAPKRVRRSSSTNTSTEQTTRARLELELHDASDQQAALAVLQSLYAVKPLPELLSELSHEQQLQAAVLADKWQVPDVSSAAAQMLIAAANTPGALAEEVQHSVLAAAALPDCLQPLQQRVLLSMLEDLEAVWADSILRDKLLGLPLHAMELLLSCNELKVSSPLASEPAAQEVVISTIINPCQHRLYLVHACCM